MVTLSKALPGPSEYIAFSKPYRDERLASFGQAWKTYGDLIRFKAIPGQDLYLAAHPDAVGHILYSHGQVYKKAERVHKTLSLLLGQGIVISEGQTWQRQRRLMQPAFHRQSLSRLGSVMTRLAQKRVEMWERYPNESAIDLTEQMQQLTLEIVGEALFSADLGENVDSFGYAFRRTAEFIDKRINSPFKFPLWVPQPQHRQFIQNREALNRIAMNLIRARRQQQDAPHDKILAKTTDQAFFDELKQSITKLQKEQIPE